MYMPSIFLSSHSLNTFSAFGVQRQLFDANIVLVERNLVRRDHLHELDDLAELVAHPVFGLIGVGISPSLRLRRAL